MQEFERKVAALRRTLEQYVIVEREMKRRNIPHDNSISGPYKNKTEERLGYRYHTLRSALRLVDLLPKRFTFGGKRPGE